MTTLIDFILARIAEQPVPERIALYRALAAETDDAQVAKCCRSLADELEAIDRRHLQLALDYKRRTA